MDNNQNFIKKKEELEKLRLKISRQEAELAIAQEKRSGHYKKLEYQLQLNKALQQQVDELKGIIENKNKDFINELVLNKYQFVDKKSKKLVDRFNTEVLANIKLKQENECLKAIKQELENKLLFLQSRFDKLEEEAILAQEKRAGHYSKLMQALERNKVLEEQVTNLKHSLNKHIYTLTWLLGEAVLQCKTVSGLFRFPANIIKANRKFRAYRALVVQNTKNDESLEDANSGCKQELVIPTSQSNSNSVNKDISILGWPEPSIDKSITIMSIADIFTTSNLKSVANLITPRPDNWEGLLNRDNPALLFVESAWNGNQNSWQYRVGSYANPPGKELSNAINEFKRQEKPTVFWNKEDPVHFDKFKNAAKEFDYIFTSDEGSIPAYQKICKAKVFALPFAADESVNNPIGSTNRLARVCFAGCYYANRFIERRNDQLMLLESALPFGLDIYDRNAGNANKDFHFPAQFKESIKGALSYEQMNQAYKQYKVFLNVNSVIDSKTMFSRRIFELLASGTPIVSTPSLGIDEFFGHELVWTVKDKAEAVEAIHTLLNDEKEWRRRSLQGIRNVFLNHMFSDRFKYVLETIGAANEQSKILPKILCCAEINKENDVQNFRSILRNQNSCGKFEMLPFLIVRNKNIKIDLPHIVDSKNSIESAINLYVLQGHAVNFITIFSSKNVYGKSYLLDLYLSTFYSDAQIITKPLGLQDEYEYVDYYSTTGSLFKYDAFNDRSFLKSFSLSKQNNIDNTLKIFSIDAANLAQKTSESVESILKQIEI